METVAKNKLYEGMFLIDSSLAGADWEGINAAIRRILEKSKAEIVSIQKWDDRRLAYDIKGQSRGTYILSYFRVDGGRIQEIEKSVRLSEKIMRVLILSAERLSQEDIEKETPAMKLEKGKQEEEKETTAATDTDSVQPPTEAGEIRESDDVGQTTETKQIPEEKIEASPETDVNATAGVSMKPEEVMEKRPEQDKIEGSGQADDKELL